MLDLIVGFGLGFIVFGPRHPIEALMEWCVPTKALYVGWLTNWFSVDELAALRCQLGFADADWVTMQRGTAVMKNPAKA